MKLVVTGAAGFIGRHFVERAHENSWDLNLLCHRNGVGDEAKASNVAFGDLGDRNVWRQLLSPGAVVVNLAFSRTDTPEMAAGKMRAMVEECKRAGVKRLIHCSTVSVYGDASSGVIGEETPCKPISLYSRTKYELEESLREWADEAFDFVILRPSEVFGEGGQGLLKLAGNLEKRSAFVNYLTACINGVRPMHLVPVSTVVDALVYMCNYPKMLGKEVFIVSEDDDAENNYRDVAAILTNELRIPVISLPIIPVPLVFLQLLLRLSRKPFAGTKAYYCNAKLTQLGFRSSMTFSDSVRSFGKTLSSK